MKQTLPFICACLLVAAAWSIKPVHAALPLPADSIASPAAEVVASDPPTVQFATASAVVAAEEERAVIPVTLSAPPSSDVEVTVSADGGTAEIGQHVVQREPTTTLTFRAGTPQPQELVVALQAADGEEGVTYLDLTLESDDVPLGAPRTFRLWIRNAALYPGLRARALTERLQSDFGPADVLSAEQAPDTLLGVVWSTAGAVRSVFTDAQATLPTKESPQTVAREQGIEVDNVWSAPLDDDAALRDLHLLMPVQADVRAARQGGQILAGAGGEGAGDEAASHLQPRDGMEGDVARALLYFYALYPEQADTEVLERLKPTLAQWMDGDPVDDDELRRSTLVARYQGTPNPFVVAPELAERAFNLRGTYPVPIVSFVRQSASVSEADSMAVIEVAVSGVGDDAVTFDLVLDESASTVDGEDLAGFRRRSVTVPGGAADGTVQRIQVPVARDDAVEETERASFVLENLSGFARTGEVGQYALNIENAEQPTQEGSRHVALGPAYPNPLSPGRGSTVQFDLTVDEAVPFSVEVFSTLGQRVHARSYSAGEAERLSSIEIDGEDLPSGLYIVRLRGPSFSITETFVVVR